MLCLLGVQSALTRKTTSKTSTTSKNHRPRAMKLSKTGLAKAKSYNKTVTMTQIIGTVVVKSATKQNKTKQKSNKEKERRKKERKKAIAQTETRATDWWGKKWQSQVVVVVVVAFSSLARILGECSTIRSLPELLFFFLSFFLFLFFSLFL